MHCSHCSKWQTGRQVSKGLWTVLLSAGLLAAACGPSSSGGKQDDDDASTGQDSSTDIDGHTTTDGFTWPDSSNTDGGMQGCDPQNFVLEQAPPPEVFLVVDRSGSMLEEGSSAGVTKWEETLGAIELVTDQFDSQIQFGLLMYPTGDECATSGPQVQVGLYNQLAIGHELSETTPNGGTPTAAAVTNAAHALEDLGNTGSEKFLILATDGGPNCNYMLSADPSCTCNLTDQSYCCTNHPDGECYFGQYCLDDAHTVQVISDLHSGSTIDTFVIGLAGTAQFAETLNSMADAGGRPQQGQTRYYDAADQTSLINALTDIAGSVISCRIELDEAPDAPDYVHIYMDGQEVSRDPNNGWSYTDQTHTAIEFNGEACETLKDGEDHNITATFACNVE
jgi:hypothetical protein